jgi:hypothetical protein
MDGKLILKLSMLGLATNLLTTFVIPSKIAPLCWLALLVACAVIIARRAPGKFFMHGLCVSLLVSVFSTAQVLLAAFKGPPVDEAIRSTMRAALLTEVLACTVAGLVSGLVLGLCAVISAKVIRRPPAASAL